MSSGTSNWKLSLCLLALAAAACTQVARQPRQSAVPWWEAGGNPPGAEEVQQDTSALAGAEAEEGVPALEAAEPPDSVAAAGEEAHPQEAVEGPDSLAAAAPAAQAVAAGTADPPEVEAARPADEPAPSPEEVQAQRQAYESRTREDRERVERVNEYALWCIERGLWEEARIHLEQAIAVDSLSASLHNNLGILYERLGEREKARAAYELAARLAPGKRLYQANLSYLRRAEEARGVPADSVEIDGLPKARERRRGTAPARETPEEG